MWMSYTTTDHAVKSAPMPAATMQQGETAEDYSKNSVILAVNLQENLRFGAPYTCMLVRSTCGAGQLRPT
jgi:hypothetical protein